MGRRSEKPPSSINAPELLHETHHQHRKTQKITETTPAVRKSRSCLLRLPYELIAGILSRLPLKSILQCKAVSKKLCNIIADPYFARIFYENPQVVSFLIWISPSRGRLYNFENSEFYLIEISENGDNFIETPFKRRFPTSGCFSSKLKLVGSCNGLLCLACDEEGIVQIWNPIANNVSDSIFTVPQHTVDRKADGFVWECYVFGYSSAVNRYKILKLLYFIDWSSSTWNVKGVIFTVGADDEWRPLSDLFEFHYAPGSIDPGVVVNGVFHWLPTTEPNERIHTFDLEDEKQDSISWPYRQPRRQKHVYDESLHVFNNQLSMIQYLENPRSMIIWIMKDYGVAESWTRIHVLRSCIPRKLIPEKEFLPVAILEKDVIVFLSGRQSKAKKLKFYDPRQKKHIKIVDLNFKCLHDFTSPYAPSFVPLNKAINADVNGVL